MGTTLRAELSEKNPYWIEKHRYYELKHFCLQYPIWKKMHSALNGFQSSGVNTFSVATVRILSNPTAKIGTLRAFYSERIDMVNRTAKLTDSDLADYIIIGVTEGCSYDILKARLNIPCCKDVYYELYRKFFWLLDKERQ